MNYIIRWEISLESNDKNFKINDAYQSYFGRMFAGKYMEVEADGTLTFL